MDLYEEKLASDGLVTLSAAILNWATSNVEEVGVLTRGLHKTMHGPCILETRRRA